MDLQALLKRLQVIRLVIMHVTELVLNFVNIHAVILVLVHVEVVVPLDV